jgi:hypothetical protein
MVMDPFSMVTAIVVVSVAGGTIRTWLKTRGQRASAAADGSERALQMEIADLRRRVATLESIVTEPSFELKQQIDQLAKGNRRAA